jgi:glycosyltransferase involved in cell wall biosynthesis
MEPLISVIIPAYNIEAYLPRCLDSVLAQTYQNLEIIIVDDGSKDGTGAIADDYAKRFPERIRCIHQENSGVTTARLNGTVAAKGEWIGYVDGDDEIEPDMYQRLMDNALKYNADISHCGYQTIVNGGERIHYFYNTGKVVEQDRITGLKDLLEGEFVEPGLWNKIFKRELFQRLLEEDLMDHSLKINEDLMMNFILFQEAGSAIYEDFCPYHYLTRSASATRAKFQPHKLLDPIRVRKWILEQADPELKDVNWRKYLVACSDAYAELSEHKEYTEKCQELKRALIDNQDKRRFLTRNEQIKLKLMMTSVGLYRFLYGFYEKRIQKKVYE